jgi:hypothetical protein
MIYDYDEDFIRICELTFIIDNDFKSWWIFIDPFGGIFHLVYSLPAHDGTLSLILHFH